MMSLLRVALAAVVPAVLPYPALSAPVLYDVEVTEPATLSLPALGALAAIRRRRR